MMTGTMFMGTMGIGLLIAILFVIAVAWGVITAWKHVRDGGRNAERDPETILKTRYARGEINRDDYCERLRELRL